MFAREGVFAEGFNLFVPGLWEYRNKITGKRLSHRLYYGYFEFDESGLEASDYDGCQEWVIEISGMKTILGISCTKATRQCDGMEQIAYFARSIAIVDGPIFIPEIPGLVLEFNDGKYVYTAQHITANENEILVPAEVRVIRKEKYSGADSRVVVNKQKMAINSWINLGAKYLIQ